MRDVEDEHVDDNEREKNVRGVEDTIVPMTQYRKRSRAHSSKHDEANAASDDVDVANALGQHAFLDEEIEVEAGVKGQDEGYNLSKEFMNSDHTLVRESSEELDRRVGRAHGEEVVKRKLRCSHNTEAFCEMEIVC